MVTYITSNGKLLNHQGLETLAKAGLDILELSLDGYDAIDGSKKSLGGDETVIDMLENAKRQYGLRFKVHQVLAGSTLQETPKLLELSRRRNVPISFGLVFDPSFEESSVDSSELRRTLELILESQRDGTPVINPAQYFQEGITSLDSPVRINCDVGRYMVQVATDGSVYVCSKLMTKKPVQFLDIDGKYFTEDQHGSWQLLDQCADKCFSACAYTTSFFRQHPLSLISSYGRR